MVDFHFQPPVQPGGQAACDDQKSKRPKKHTLTLGLWEEIAFLDSPSTPKAVPPFPAIRLFVRRFLHRPPEAMIPPMYNGTHNPYGSFDSQGCSFGGYAVHMANAQPPQCTQEDKGRAPSKLLLEEQFEREQSAASLQSLHVPLTKCNGNVYVSNLAPELDEKWLRAEFGRFGLISSANVMTKNGVGKGYGFVQFIDPQNAVRALKEMNGSYVGDRCLSLKLADRDKDRGASNQPSNNLYVGNLPVQFGVDAVSELFSPWGPISSLVVLSDPVTGGSRGVGLVRYHTVEDSTRAVKALNGVLLKEHDRPLEVKFAETSMDKHARKSGKKHGSAANKRGGANPRVRNNKNGEPRTPSNGTRPSNGLAPILVDAWSSSNSNTDSNGSAEVESPVSGGTNRMSNGHTHGNAQFPRSGPSGPKTLPKGAGPAAPRPRLGAMMPSAGVLSHGPMAPDHQQTTAQNGFMAMEPYRPIKAHKRVEMATLRVVGLPQDMDEVELYKLFTPFGAVKSVRRDSSNQRTAFIHYRLPSDALVALHHLNGLYMHGVNLKVSLQ